jgi:hypothetical protein
MIRIPGWRVFSQPERGTAVLLHPTGLWTEVDWDSWQAIEEQQTSAIIAALSAAVGAVTGRAEIQITRVYGEPDIIRVVKCPAP